MHKKVNLTINKFPITPNSLRENPKSNICKDSIELNLTSLYHHYYLDNYGRRPPEPDPTNFEYLSFLCNTEDFRFQGDGLGISTASRRGRSTDMGQAFCRMFLYDHLNVTYFAHMQHVLDKSTHQAFNGVNIERVSAGDTPDYFCAENVNKIFIAEAKGRYSSIGFNTKEFNNWRDQFKRIVVKDKSGIAKSIKGFIVATHFSTEKNKLSNKTAIYAEDPNTLGEYGFSEESNPSLSQRIISLHYSNIAHKINQQMLAMSLYGGYTLPMNISYPATVWSFADGIMKGKRFVGGYYSKDGIYDTNGRLVLDYCNLQNSKPVFFGVEEEIFKSLVNTARNGMKELSQITKLEYSENIYSGISIFRDGTIISPLEFLRVADVIQY